MSNTETQLQDGDSLASSDAKELAERRRERLKQLIGELHGFEPTASLLGVSRAKLSRLVNLDQRSSREINDAEAREFERRANKPDGWLDISDREDRLYLELEEELPPSAKSRTMKSYGENLFLEAWAQRLKVNAIRHRGLFGVINVSIWRSGWLTATGHGQLKIAEAGSFVRHLRDMSAVVSASAIETAEGEAVHFAQDTVVIGGSGANDISYFVNPDPVPGNSIHTYVLDKQELRVKQYGDLAAVFQISLWGDETIRAAFSGFPFRHDAEDVATKLSQLADLLQSNMSLHRKRQSLQKLICEK